MLLSYLLVFILAAIPLFELIAVVPLAIVGGLSPIPVAILGFLGNIITVLFLILFVDNVKSWMRRRKQKRKLEVESEENQPIAEEEESKEHIVEDDSKKAKRARVLFDKYGLPGLTIVGPLIVGSHISAFMGMSFGSSRKRVTIWMLISLVLWTIVTAVAASYGVTYFIPDAGDNGFLIRLFQ